MNDDLDKLTKPWSDVLSPKETGRDGYTPIDYPPMLDMLREAIGSSVGTTGRSSSSVGTTGRSSSSGGEMSILNLQALQLWEHIDGTVRAWWGELSKQPCPRDLKDALNRLGGMLAAAHASHQIRTDMHQHINGMFPRWVERIWDLFDPPITKELTGSCPNPDCGATTWTDGNGDQSTALVAYYWRGLQPHAKCRCCPWEWSTPAELVVLGKHLGATIDWAFLEAAGVA